MLRSGSVVLSTCVSLCSAQGFVFTPVETIAATPVRDQARTGTCWSFATTSFLESELLRLGKGRFDLAEMFVVRQAYPRKADRYVRLHGEATLGPGGLAPDVLTVFRDYGAVPESVYGGRLPEQTKHDHGELDAVLKGMLDAVVQRGALTSGWRDAVAGVLDAYLGAVPATFDYEGVEYTPRSFADSLGIDPAAYLCLTSYTHHPFGQQVPIDVPDNWAGNTAWNVPLDDLMAVLEHALANGFTVAWDGDVSERSCKGREGIAVLPQKAWGDRTEAERATFASEPEPEIEVTQAVRQRQFDTYETTDDHLMHLVGMAKDQNGTLYFTAKNSSGTLRSQSAGMIQLSTAYTRAKTISILLHRDGVPAAVLARLGLAPGATTGDR
ncbi:MAG: aminopeptidase [Planctomycetes bacterium]|nr:aminopeptidase [Planctomycetota bacterium]